MKLRILFGIALTLMLVGSLSAQTPDPGVTVSPKLEVGLGSYFGEEDVTFDTDALYLSTRIEGVQFPFRDASTGVAFELGFSTFSGTTNYSLWSINRMDMIKGRIYAGTDMKFGQSVGLGYDSNFDVRIVTGAYLGKIGPLNAALEVNFLEENRPISFVVKLGR